MIQAPTRLVLLALLALATSREVRAVDGVIEINQARALAGGITPGDSAGFPATLSQPGSYRLTGNLTVPDGDTTAISVVASGITVDLGGFAISGPNSVSDTPSCSAAGSGQGITSGFDGTIVRDGLVRGMGSHGVLLGSASRIERVTAQHNCGYGLGIGEGGVITDSQAHRSRLFGLYSSGRALVEKSTAYDNMDNGIHLNPGSLALGCVSSKNRAYGFYSSDATSAVGDSVFYDNTLGVTGGKTIGCNNFDGTVLCAPPGSS